MSTLWLMHLFGICTSICLSKLRLWHFVVYGINNIITHVNRHSREKITKINTEHFYIYDNSANGPSIRNNIFLVYNEICLEYWWLLFCSYLTVNMCVERFFFLSSVIWHHKHWLRNFFRVKDMLSLFVTTFNSISHSYILRMLRSSFSLIPFPSLSFFSFPFAKRNKFTH